MPCKCEADAPAGANGRSRALLDILRERERGQLVCGYGVVHDDIFNKRGQLAHAAAYYAAPNRVPHTPKCWLDRAHETGEDHRDYVRALCRRDQLVAAGALIVAEIERIDRLREQLEKL